MQRCTIHTGSAGQQQRTESHLKEVTPSSSECLGSTLALRQSINTGPWFSWCLLDLLQSENQLHNLTALWKTAVRITQAFSQWSCTALWGSLSQLKHLWSLTSDKHHTSTYIIYVIILMLSTPHPHFYVALPHVEFPPVEPKRSEPVSVK